MPNKKAGHTVDKTFGSSAISLQKTRRFPPPSHEGFGIVGLIIIFYYLLSSVLFVNLKTFMKLIKKSYMSQIMRIVGQPYAIEILHKKIGYKNLNNRNQSCNLEKILNY
jgi:hypothetical protein